MLFLIGMRYRHITVIPVIAEVTNCGIVKTIAQRFCVIDVINCGIVKTIGGLVMSTLRDFIDVALAHAN